MITRLPPAAIHLRGSNRRSSEAKAEHAEREAMTGGTHVDGDAIASAMHSSRGMARPHRLIRVEGAGVVAKFRRQARPFRRIASHIQQALQNSRGRIRRGEPEKGWPDGPRGLRRVKTASMAMAAQARVEEGTAAPNTLSQPMAWEAHARGDVVAARLQSRRSTSHRGGTVENRSVEEPAQRSPHAADPHDSKTQTISTRPVKAGSDR